MRLVGIDHLVLTVEDVNRTCSFYADALGADVVRFDGGRTALHFGDQKINLHPAGDEYKPHAQDPRPGSGDFCLIAEGSIEDVRRRLDERDVDIEHGPVDKRGARGPMRSVYVHDPDGNLVEIAMYDE